MVIEKGASPANTPSHITGQQSDIEVARRSLSEIQDTLSPQYAAIRAGFLGHGALQDIAETEYLLEQAQADIALMEGFGALLPTQRRQGSFDPNPGALSGKYYHINEPSVELDDLNEAKLVQAHSVLLNRHGSMDANGNGYIADTFAYVVGSHKQDKGKVELLLVSPPSHDEYHFIENETPDEPKIKVIEEGAKVFRVSVQPKAFAAMEAFSETSFSRAVR